MSSQLTIKIFIRKLCLCARVCVKDGEKSSERDHMYVMTDENVFMIIHRYTKLKPASVSAR